VTSLELPTLNRELPRLSAAYKTEPADFFVREVPAYEPADAGDHLYLCCEREGWNTRDLIEVMAQTLGCAAEQIGYAGLKDRQARVQQVFSIPALIWSEQDIAEKLEVALPLKILWARRHPNKLKRGHLKGNHFEILLRTEDSDALSKAQAITDYLQTVGLPNFYGEQRFGRDGDNAQAGLRLLQGGRKRRDWKGRLLLSAFQSQLFNQWLAERMARGQGRSLMTGDVAKKWETGGIFTVEDLAAEQARFDAGEITYTGPIYGKKMRWAEANAGDAERHVLDRAGLEPDAFAQQGLKGSRRIAWLKLRDLDVAAHPDGVLLKFFLPKGSYATVLLREFLLPA